MCESLISEDGRDTAVQRLQEAHAEGHISHEEMDERLHQILSAKTHSELLPALASLPAKNVHDCRRRRTDQAARCMAGTSHPRGRVRIRKGAPRPVPRVIDHPVLDIELQLGTGRAKITVPRDAIVDFEELRTGRKDTLYKPPTPLPVRRPTIRISGTMRFGRLEIHHARR